MSFRVRWTREAETDRGRLFYFVIARHWASDSGDLELAEQALTAIQAGVATLSSSPFTCRKVGTSPFLRELIIAFGNAGYVALFEIVDPTEVVVTAVRHQLEEDYH